MIYSGPIDEYFDFRFGKLPYRCLKFEHETLDEEQFQAVGTVNSPQTGCPYTRVTEYKHLTGQQHPKTSITYEYPAADGDPYYPIPRPENQELYKRYEALARRDRVWLRRPACDLSLLQHGPDRRPGAGHLPADGRAPRQPGHAGGDGGSRPSRCVPRRRWNCGAASNARSRASATIIRNQLVETGHMARIEDLDAMAALGVKAVRYPILWETVAPETPDRARFLAGTTSGWSGFASLASGSLPAWCHHGSGPRYTELLEPRFPGPSCRLRRQGRAALPVDRAVDSGQRAADHRALLVPLRPLVPAPQEYRHHLPGALVNQCLGELRAMRAIRKRDPERAADRNRGCRQDLRDAAAAISGRPRERTPLAQPRPAVRPRRRPAIRSTAGCATRRRSTMCSTSSATGDARPDMHRHQPLSHQRALPRSPAEPLSATHRSAPTGSIAMSMSKPSGRHLERRARASARGCAKPGTATYPDRRHRSPSRLHPRRTGPLAHAKCGRPPKPSAQRRRRYPRRHLVVDVRTGRLALAAHAPRGPLRCRGVRRPIGTAASDRCLPKPRRSWARASRSTIRCSTCPAGGSGPAAAYARPRYHTLSRALEECPAVADHRRHRHARPGLREDLRASRPCPCPHHPRPARHHRRSFDCGGDRSSSGPGRSSMPPALSESTRPKRAATNASGSTPPAPSCSRRACSCHGLPIVTFSSDLVFDGQLGRSYVEPDLAAPTGAYGAEQGRGGTAASGHRCRCPCHPHQRLLRPVGPAQFPVHGDRAVARAASRSVQAVDRSSRRPMCRTSSMRRSTCCSTRRAASGTSPTTAR